MEREVDRVDVAVIGGGPAGLAAGAYLARTGLRVRIFEKSSAIGGRAATRHEDGFYLNRGAHALYQGGEAEAVLSELGVAFGGHLAPTNGKALRAGSLYQLPTGAVSLFTTGLLSLRAKTVAAQWLEKTPKVSPRTVENLSVSEWLSGCPDEVRALIETFVRVATFVNRPSEFSAGTALIQLQRALAGVLYVDGGWQTLVEGLAGRARSWGARITENARVVGLERAGGEYLVSLGDGDAVVANNVVLAVAPRDAASLLASAGAPPVASLLSAVPVQVATLDLALSRLPRRDSRFVLGVDQPLYLSVHSTVAKLAPEGGAVIHMLKYLTGTEQDPEADRREMEGLLDLAQPGWRAEVVHAQYLPRMSPAERIDLATEGGASGRPGTCVPGLPGVVLAGDWVQGGSWLLDATLGSARAAARAIAERRSPARAVA